MKDKKKEASHKPTSEAVNEQTQGSQPEENVAQDPIALLESAIKESESKYLRMLAEYDNFRKRSKKESEQLYSSAFAQGVGSFLPVLDNIGRAVAQNCTDEEYKKGILLIDKQVKELMEKLGMVEFGSVGESFDPELHNAVMHVEDDSMETNVIAEVFQSGMKIKDRVIRFATVKVAN